MELTKNFINNSKIIRSTIFVLIGSALLAISSKIQTPFTPVPATMQTFVVMFLGIVLGYKLATLTVIIYLIEGSFGLPVFAKGGGIGYLFGPTGGYLIGFIVAGYLAGKFIYNNNLIKNFLKLSLATSFIYILGMLWLGSLIGWEKPIFELGAKPFLLAELFKILIATLMVKQFKKFRKFI